MGIRARARSKSKVNYSFQCQTNLHASHPTLQLEKITTGSYRKSINLLANAKANGNCLLVIAERCANLKILFAIWEKVNCFEDFTFVPFFKPLSSL